MKILALITARGGSKGIPRKNVRLLGSEPLVAWTIEAARDADGIDRVVVSTEDREIADIAKRFGAEVPFMRPNELAKDDTPAIDVVLHVLSRLPVFDWILLLQPTSPLRTSDDIEGIITFCLERGAPAAVSVCEARQHPEWMYRRDVGDRLVPLMNIPSGTLRQDLTPTYALNGALYLARCDWLVEHRSFLGEETLGYFMPPERSVDIDTELDWAWAEFLLSRKRG